jgi:hypothetical protein
MEARKTTSYRWPSGASDFEVFIRCVSMPEMMRSSPMREENEAQHKNRHEEIILSDHDALLLLFPLTNPSMFLYDGGRCDQGNPFV